jgi:hypothetical protein
LACRCIAAIEETICMASRLIPIRTTNKPRGLLVVGSFGFSGRFGTFPLASGEFGMKLRDAGIKD